MFKAAKLNGIIPTCFTCFYVGDATMMNHQVWEKTPPRAVRLVLRAMPLLGICSTSGKRLYE